MGLGYSAGLNLTTGAGNVCIGYGVLGFAGESNTTRIKNIYSSVASGRAVHVNSDNKIGTLVSSRRFKEEIKPMDKASEAILALKPVSFHYKKEIEPNGAMMFGLRMWKRRIPIWSVAMKKARPRPCDMRRST